VALHVINSLHGQCHTVVDNGYNSATKIGKCPDFRDPDCLNTMLSLVEHRPRSTNQFDPYSHFSIIYMQIQQNSNSQGHLISMQFTTRFVQQYGSLVSLIRMWASLLGSVPSSENLFKHFFNLKIAFFTHSEFLFLISAFTGVQQQAWKPFAEAGGPITSIWTSLFFAVYMPRVLSVCDFNPTDLSHIVCVWVIQICCIRYSRIKYK